MKVFAAKYTDCYHEYAPSVFSLHTTREGAERAIANSQEISFTGFREMQEWVRSRGRAGIMGYGTNREWSPKDGTGFEKWEISEMEVNE